MPSTTANIPSFQEVRPSTSAELTHAFKDISVENVSTSMTSRDSSLDSKRGGKRRKRNRSEGNIETAVLSALQEVTQSSQPAPLPDDALAFSQYVRTDIFQIKDPVAYRRCKMEILKIIDLYQSE